MTLESRSPVPLSKHVNVLTLTLAIINRGASHMRNLIVAVTVSLFVSPVAMADEGFESLFDGKSLTGWHIMNGGKFAANEGVIQLRGGSGWLRSDREFTDFVLRLEVRWLKPRQDSGIFLRASKEGKNWPAQAYEVQCENSERVAMLFGAKYKLNKEKAAKVLKGVNEWNTYEIRCVGTRCEVKLNDELVCTSDDLRRPGGYLGIQGENGQLDFRNIQIRTINPKK